MEAIIKSRIDVDLKTEVESVLSALGMTVSDVMRITFAQIAARKGLPFDVKLPNAETLSALKESDAALARLRSGAKPRFDQLEDYFAAMDAKVSKSVKPVLGKVVPKSPPPVRAQRAVAR
jgi:DNA-damage-inducible protein J